MAILEKIRVLDRFTTVYNAQPVPRNSGHVPVAEPYYDLYPVKKGEPLKRDTNSATAYAYPKQNVRYPSFISRVFFTKLD
jgi:hypothetical protein